MKDMKSNYVQMVPMHTSLSDVKHGGTSKAWPDWKVALLNSFNDGILPGFGCGEYLDDNYDQKRMERGITLIVSKPRSALIPNWLATFSFEVGPRLHYKIDEHAARMIMSDHWRNWDIYFYLAGEEVEDAAT